MRGKAHQPRSVWSHVRRGYTNLQNGHLQDILLSLNGVALKVYLLLYSWRNLGAEFTPRGIAEGLEVSPRAVQKALALLAERGLVEKGGRGWRVALKGERQVAGVRTVVRGGANGSSRLEPTVGGEDPVQDGASCPPHTPPKLNEEKKNKLPQYSVTSVSPTRSPEMERSVQNCSNSLSPKGEEALKSGPSLPQRPQSDAKGKVAGSGPNRPQEVSPALVNFGTNWEDGELIRDREGRVHLKATLQRHRLWKSFVGLFRPETQSPEAFWEWMTRIIPLVDTVGLRDFVRLMEETREDVLRGGIRSPQKLFRSKLEKVSKGEEVLKDVGGSASHPPTPGEGPYSVRVLEADQYTWARLSNGFVLHQGDWVEITWGVFKGKKGVIDELSPAAKRASVVLNGREEDPDAYLSLPLGVLRPLEQA